MRCNFSYRSGQGPRLTSWQFYPGQAFEPFVSQFFLVGHKEYYRVQQDAKNYHFEIPQVCNMLSLNIQRRTGKSIGLFYHVLHRQ